MIKSVLKRNGESEPFSASKLNKWGCWAARNIGTAVDWSQCVLDAVKDSPDEMTSQQLQQRLIDSALLKNTWAHSLMAGRLYAALVRKSMFGDTIPTIRKLHKKLLKNSLIRQLAYTDAEYDEINNYIDHARDFNMAHFQIDYILHKYSIQNRATKKIYETPQFVYMRMAMALAEDEPPAEKMKHLKNWYDHFSSNRINAPTPNYVNLGTPHYGLSSCCLYSAGDTSKSLAIGDHIAYTQTYMSAGIGANIMCRSLGDPVRRGLIKHLGKLSYYKSLAAAVKANVQGGRGGACTVYFSCFDPEVQTIIMLQNPRTPVAKQNRDLHFAMLSNRLFAKYVAQNKDIFTFTEFSAPDLHKLFYSGDQDGFESLYEKYESNTKFKKTYISARKILISAGTQSYDTATLYHAIIDEMNRNTPFNDPIRLSNLCTEICEPTEPYYDMMDLYSSEDHGRGEVALCTIAGIVEPNIENDEQYASAAYYALKMIDKCIDLADYALPHIKYTALQRRNAGVGLIGIAETMAKHDLKYDTPEGRQKLHEIAERHAYHVISQSLAIGKEHGNAPWIHKTKWVDGWTPVQTYKKSVDELANPVYNYDWDALSDAIRENGGIRHSTLIAHMPSESSSKASGVSNGVYPVRDISIKKSDSGNNIMWCARYSDVIGSQYQSAWNISETDMLKAYAVIQKFTDQSTSADLYVNRSKTFEITTDQIIESYLCQVKYGVKTRYYMNSKTSSNESSDERGCASGVCTL
jgi:ribonucleoside-diphosphate reductase alpha chain